MKLVGVGRAFFGLMYVFGGVVDLAAGLSTPGAYDAWGDAALIPGLKTLWDTVVLSHVSLYALLIAAFEISIGLLILNRGSLAKIGLVAGAAYSLYLFALGTGLGQTGLWPELWNRIPALMLAGLQLLLVTQRLDKNLVLELRGWFRPRLSRVG